MKITRKQAFKMAKTMHDDGFGVEEIGLKLYDAGYASRITGKALTPAGVSTLLDPLTHAWRKDNYKARRTKTKTTDPRMKAVQTILAMDTLDDETKFMVIKNILA